MTHLRSDWSMARRIAQWQRLIAKRNLSSSRVFRIARIVFLCVAFALMAAGMTMPVLIADNADYVGSVSLFGTSFLLYIDVMVLFQTIFAEPTGLLLTAPLRGWAVVLSRAYPLLRGSLLIAALGLPMCVAFGIRQGANALYYVGSLLGLLGTVWFCVAFALLLVLVSMMLLRKAPSRDSLAVLSSIVAVLLLLGPRLLIGHFGSAVATMWQETTWALLPLTWLGHLLVELASGHPRGLLYLGLLWMLVIALLYVSSVVANRYVHDRMTRMTEAPVRKRRRTRRSVSAAVAVLQSEHTHVEHRPVGTWSSALVIARKDWLRLRRSPQEWISYVFPTAYLAFFLLQSRDSGSMFSTLPLLVLVLSSTMGRLPITSFGQEDEQIWLLLQAPVARRHIVLGKWLYGTVPTLLWWWLVVTVFAILHAITIPMAVTLAIAGLWMIPSAMWITMPFAIRGAAFVKRKIGRRSVHVNPVATWYMAALIPYLLLQTVAIGFAVLPMAGSSVPAAWISFLALSPAWHLGLGIALSLLLALAASWITLSLSMEAWQHREERLLLTGGLD